MNKINLTITFIVILLCVLAENSIFQPVRASGPVYIRADGTVDPSGAPIQRTEDLYTLTANITSDTDGIIVEKSGITIDGNGETVQGGPSGRALYLYGINNVTIKNTRTKGFRYGIYAESTSRNVIYKNNMTGSTYDGIGLYNSSDNIVLANNMNENGWSGIGLYFSSGNNISANYITNNYFGVNFYLSQNKIFHNNFISNINQTSSDTSLNVWDDGYPSGGNYWSDYNGTDSLKGPDQNQPGSDVIGDTPYNCSENNQDKYPLMQVFTNIAVQGVAPIKTVVGQGYSVNIEILVENQGWEKKTTDIAAYLNTTAILTFNGLVMSGRNQTIWTYTWQTSGYSKENYTISASATAVPGETDSTDNNCTWTVHVGVPGDVSSSVQGVYDGTVNMRDAQYMILQFNTKPSSPKWKPNADANNDLVVNMRDIQIVIMNFNKHE